jgi:glycosidase
MPTQINWNKLYQKLRKIYPSSQLDNTITELKQIAQEFQKRTKNQKGLQKKFNLSSSDIALVSYANTLKESGSPTLNTLYKFIKDLQLEETINTLHILPFFPWDTDRGFSIKNYYLVKNDYGNWGDINSLVKKVNLMFDFVANHASIKNPLIQNALIERHVKKTDHNYKKYSYYKDFVIAFSNKNKPTQKKLSKLARPRPNPVLTKYSVFKTKNGKLQAVLGSPKGRGVEVLGTGWVWTTFSRPKNPNGSENTRQVDLNFANPKVLIETIKILLFYIEKGAMLIRLDAIGYIWKRLGSSSLHEKESHLILEIIHDVISFAAPAVVTIAEVNEPQDKVIKYLGKESHKESDLVYQFTHFPLAVYAVLTGNAKPYKEWLDTIYSFNGRQFITVLGTHDGMGLKPARGFLTESQIENLTNILINENKALPNYASLPGGKRIIYEICATPYNLINGLNSNESIENRLKKYLVVLALGLTLPGLPAIYINGLLGSKNYLPESGLDENRTVNREVFEYEKLKEEIKNKDSQIGVTFKGVMNLLKIRKTVSAIDPDGDFKKITTGNKSIVSTLNIGEGGKKYLISLVNVSGKVQKADLKLPSFTQANRLNDALTNTEYKISHGKININLQPYQVLWLQQKKTSIH